MLPKPPVPALVPDVQVANPLVPSKPKVPKELVKLSNCACAGAEATAIANVAIIITRITALLIVRCD